MGKKGVERAMKWLNTGEKRPKLGQKQAKMG